MFGQPVQCLEEDLEYVKRDHCRIRYVVHALLDEVEFGGRRKLLQQIAQLFPGRLQNSSCVPISLIEDDLPEGVGAVAGLGGIGR